MVFRDKAWPSNGVPLDLLSSLVEKAVKERFEKEKLQMETPAVNVKHEAVCAEEVVKKEVRVQDFQNVSGETTSEKKREIDCKMEKQCDMEKQNWKAQQEASHDVLDTNAGEKLVEDLKPSMTSLDKDVADSEFKRYISCYASVPRRGLRRFCKWCHRRDGVGTLWQPRWCGGCGRVEYCSRQCQEAHWQHHQTQCYRWRPGHQSARWSFLRNVDVTNWANCSTVTWRAAFDMEVNVLRQQSTGCHAGVVIEGSGLQ